jgi:two-component system chemotaxis response regulator CheB
MSFMNETTERSDQPGRALNWQGVKRDVIVIGASAGGVEALGRLFSMLPRDLPAIIGCVMHRGMIPSQLASVLGRQSSLPIREPPSGEAVQRGVIYLAPPDQHLLFTPHGVEVSRGPREHSTRPAVDPLFRSAAATYGDRVVGLLLTGAGQDGMRGMIAIAQSQGLTLVQDPEDAYMPHMPLSAIQGDHVQGSFPLDGLPGVLATLAEGGAVDGRVNKRNKS